MTDATIREKDRDAVRILAFAGREFDRVRDLLVDDDEPGAQQVAGAAARSDDEARNAAERTRRGPLGLVLGGLRTVARGAGRVVAGRIHPAHANWSQAPADERIDWWVGRFGTAAAALAAVPGLGGRIGKLSSLDDVVASAAQVLIVHAVAREMGVSDLGRRVAVAGKIVLGRDLDPEAVTRALGDPEAQPEDTVPGDADEDKRGPLARVGRSAALVWRVADRIRRLHSDLDRRRKGGLLVRAIGNLPAVGALGSFLSERKGISRAADEARAAFQG
ncbi:hypothetical protein [Agilicoccus flavus]|uniref:hypothetical protein n=1 Tax=Agilicoccus flavus TaxID=2775968 RepID=UPI001CF71C9A|nr:hypothetical protein [Agilicoccus flavus]